ncbi:MAG: glycerol dehydrogenase [Lachnospiraceae bacterium]|nr:glycerol dehydrogenase [Lachnospiraceae bacterium]
MATIFFAPSKYVQGAGVMNDIGMYAARLGKKALVVISEGGLKRQGEQIKASFAANNTEMMFEKFNGECSDKEIHRIADLAKENGCDLIIGVGGGKIFDTSKAAAYYDDIPVIVAPTIASTDAPCSALSVVYTEEGVFQDYLFLKQNPDLVLMDTEIISKSPVRFTVAGMGDAMATYFEAQACYDSNAATCADGGQVGVAALGIAKLCHDTLLSDGVKAKMALDAHALTPAVERVIEANTLLSGIGFESGGLAGAHAIHNGLTVLPECHHMQHGEKVNFGTLTQLVLQNVPEDDLYELLDWMVTIGLPVTLGELGITDLSKEHLMPAAEAACAENDTLGNVPVVITAEKVYNAMLAADAYGRSVLEDAE